MSNLPIKIPEQEMQADYEIGGHELICQVRKTSHVLYAIFVEVVRKFYSDEDNMPIFLPGVKWDPSPEKSGLWIDTELRWEDDHPEVRPAIFVSLGPIEYHSLTGRFDGRLGSNLRDAETFYSRSGSGVVTFNHIGNTDGEACVLADATHDYLDAFSSVIRDDFCFTKLYLQNRVPLVRRPKESGERWGSSVSVGYEFEDTWAIKQESQLLKKISFNAGQGLLASVILNQ